MNNPILAEWEFSAKTSASSLVIPDGCRDLIFWSSQSGTPNWSITSLDESAYSVSIKKGDFLKAYRLKPGIFLSKEKLLGSVRHLVDGQVDVADRLGEFTCLFPSVEEALACLASGLQTVNEAAAMLGVSTRTLQRLLKSKTGRTPARWLSLARARKTARIAPLSHCLTETALACGYSDQSHMNRDFKRWFNVSPAKIGKAIKIQKQLAEPGYF